MIEMLAPAVTAIGVLVTLFWAAVLIGRIVLSGYRGPSWRRENWLVFAAMLFAAAFALAPFYL